MYTFRIFLIVFLFPIVIFSQTNYWQGDFWPNSWHTANAWSLGHEPTPTEDVIIPGGLLNYPFLIGTAYAKDLILHDGASLELRSDINLDIYGNFHIAGEIEVFGTSVDGTIDVSGYVKWYDTGNMGHYSSDPEYIWNVEGNWYFDDGSLVDMNHNEVKFIGSGSATIYTNSDNAVFYKIQVNKPSGSVTWSSTSTNDLETNYLDIEPSSTFQTWCTRNVKVKTFFYNDGEINMNNGTFQWGFSGGSVSCDVNDYFYHLELYPWYTTGTTFNGEVIVNGNFTVLVGGSSPGSLTFNDHLIVKGDFTNDIADKLSISKITFNGAGVQECNNARCDTLVLAKAEGDELRFPSGVSIAESYDWQSGWLRVNGGNLVANDLLDPGIFGTISLTSGSITFTQDEYQYIDLRAYLFISGGTFQVNGGNGDSYWPWNDNATLTMGGGILSFDQGIYINNNAGFTDNITGGEIRTIKDFRVVRSDFNPSGGTISMLASVPAQDSVRLQCNSGSSLHHLYIAKTSPIPVVTTSDIVINGDLTIFGGHLKSDKIIHLKGNYTSSPSYAFIDNGSTIYFDGPENQIFDGWEDLGKVIMDKDGDTLLFLSSVIYMDTFNWEGGTINLDYSDIEIGDLEDYAVYGSYLLTGISQLDINQDPIQSIDLNANIVMRDESSVLLHGGKPVSNWANFTSAGLDIELNCGLIIDNDVRIRTTNDFDLAMSGGVIWVTGDFINDRNDFQPLGGEIRLGFGENLSVKMVTGSYFHHLWINNKNYSGSLIGDVTALTDLQIKGNLYFDQGVFTPMNLEIFGDYRNLVGPSAFIEGTHMVTFSGTDHSEILTNEDFYDLIINKSSATSESLIFADGDTIHVANNCFIADGRIQMGNHTMLVVDHDFSIANGAGLDADGVSPVDFYINGNWLNYNATSTSYQGFHPGTSLVYLDGFNDQQILQPYQAGKFYDLKIQNHDYQVPILQNLAIQNDLHIIKGEVIAPDSLWVGGDWQNDGGTASFSEGSNVVIFNGNGPSDLISGETFFDLTLDKVYTGAEGLEMMNNTTIMVKGKLDIVRGVMELNDHSILDIEGDLEIRYNAGLNADDTDLNILVGGDWYDFNSAWSGKLGFNPGTSTVTFDGDGHGQSVYCDATDADFYNIIIDKLSGLPRIDFVAFFTDTRVNNDVTVVEGRWYDPSSENNTHRFYNNVTIQSGAKWYGGISTIIFSGTEKANWSPSPILTDCTFSHIVVDRVGGAVIMQNDGQSINGATLTVINGSLDLNGHDLYIGGNGEILENGKVLNRDGGQLRIGVDPI